MKIGNYEFSLPHQLNNSYTDQSPVEQLHKKKYFKKGCIWLAFSFLGFLGFDPMINWGKYLLVYLQIF